MRFLVDESGPAVPPGTTDADGDVDAAAGELVGHGLSVAQSISDYCVEMRLRVEYIGLVTVSL